MTTALARRGEGSIERGSLPPLQEAQAEVGRLVQAARTDALGEVRRQAEAHGLYEQRAGAINRANHYIRLQLLAEAGLASIEKSNGGKPNPEWWRLACLYERGVLLEVCDQHEAQGGVLRRWYIANDAVQHGWTVVPRRQAETFFNACKRGEKISHKELAKRAGVQLRRGGPDGCFPWSVVRAIAHYAELDPSDLPPDPRAVERETERREQARQRAYREREALRIQEEAREFQRNLSRVKKNDGDLYEAASLIVRAAGHLEKARKNSKTELDRDLRDIAQAALQRAEEEIRAAVAEAARVHSGRAGGPK